jgi:hypothetical protein
MKKAQENKSYFSQIILFVLTSKVLSILLLFSFFFVDAKNQQVNYQENHSKFKESLLIFSNVENEFENIEFEEFFDTLDEFFEHSQINFILPRTIVLSNIFLQKLSIENYCKVPYYLLFKQLKLDVF